MKDISIVVFTAISFLLRVIKTVKTKHTKDLSIGMYSFIVTGVLIWFVCGFLIDDILVIIANRITSCLATIILLNIEIQNNSFSGREIFINFAKQFIKYRV